MSLTHSALSSKRDRKNSVKKSVSFSNLDESFVTAFVEPEDDPLVNKDNEQKASVLGMISDSHGGPVSYASLDRKVAGTNLDSTAFHDIPNLQANQGPITLSMDLVCAKLLELQQEQDNTIEGINASMHHMETIIEGENELFSMRGSLRGSMGLAPEKGPRNVVSPIYSHNDEKESNEFITNVENIADSKHLPISELFVNDVVAKALALEQHSEWLTSTSADEKIRSSPHGNGGVDSSTLEDPSTRSDSKLVTQVNTNVAKESSFDHKTSCQESGSKADSATSIAIDDYREHEYEHSSNRNHSKILNDLRDLQSYTPQRQPTRTTINFYT